MFAIRLFAATLVVLAASGQSAFASICSFDDGGVYQISGNSIGDGLDVSNCTVVQISDVPGINCGSIDVSGSGVLIFEGYTAAPLGGVSSSSDPPASAPEPNTIIIWSVLGGFGIAIGWRRRFHRAA